LTFGVDEPPPPPPATQPLYVTARTNMKFTSRPLIWWTLVPIAAVVIVVFAVVWFI
jgi:hypothetical protein